MKVDTESRAEAWREAYILAPFNFLKTAKAVNEDPACLYVGSHRRSNQPNLKNNDEKCYHFAATIGGRVISLSW